MVSRGLVAKLEKNTDRKYLEKLLATDMKGWFILQSQLVYLQSAIDKITIIATYLGMHTHLKITFFPTTHDLP